MARAVNASGQIPATRKTAVDLCVKRETVLTEIHPKLPMRDKAATQAFYIGKLGFSELGAAGYDEYLMVKKDAIEIHFFLFRELDPRDNYGQVYIRTDDIDQLYQGMVDSGTAIHPAGSLQTKPWGQREFSLLDPDHNLLTFGQSICEV